MSIDAHLHAGKNTLLFKTDQLLTFLVRTLLIPSYSRRNRVNLANTFQFLKEYLKKKKKKTPRITFLITKRKISSSKTHRFDKICYIYSKFKESIHVELTRIIFLIFNKKRKEKRNIDQFHPDFNVERKPDPSGFHRWRENFSSTIHLRKHSVGEQMHPMYMHAFTSGIKCISRGFGEITSGTRSSDATRQKEANTAKWTVE